MIPIHERCPFHDRPKSGADGVYTCGCLIYEASLYHHYAMGGGCDPRWLKPDDWYALQVSIMKERAPA